MLSIFPTRLRLAIVAFVLAIAIASFQQTIAEPTTKGTDATTHPVVDQLTFDYRCVRDMARCKLVLIASQNTMGWMVADIRPVEGYRHEINGVRLTEEGEQVGNWNAPSKEFREGFIHRVALLSRDFGQTLFAYRDYSSSRISTLPDDAGYSPFLEREGGTVICRYNGDDLADLARFDPVYLLPTAWRDNPVKALGYVTTHSGIFDPAFATKNQSTLICLLKDENPLLSIAACRALAAGGTLDSRAIRAILGPMKDRVQGGALTMVLLNNIRPEQRELLHTIASDVFHQPHSLQLLQGAALGVAVTVNGSPRGRPNTDALVLREWLRDAEQPVGNPPEVLAEFRRILVWAHAGLKGPK